MDKCIFCLQEHYDTTVEHIVPGSLGNVHYVLPKGTVCARCNHRFSKYENKVLSSREFLQERTNSSEEIEAPLLSKSSLVPFLLKIGYESFYKSKRNIWSSYDFNSLRTKLVDGSMIQWDILRYDPEQMKLKPIPGFIERLRLRASGVTLDFVESRDPSSLIFVFRYRRIVSAIDLLQPQRA